MSRWHDTLFDQRLKAAFLANYGLGSASAVVLSSAEATPRPCPLRREHREHERRMGELNDAQAVMRAASVNY
ncbi:hypothetical protein [Sorangium cellulosum]|uniref:Uncharacterized protein n=1 Tax=Sorangium cellulosum TaxID=56 RepID=A0A150QLU5_SORCE|nr:hypothetical protein [Sorangium cellulosum]KYF68920.1 hypothetical protein BE15_21570 [Sorangium cellulosum]